MVSGRCFSLNLCHSSCWTEGHCTSLQAVAKLAERGPVSAPVLSVPWIPAPSLPPLTHCWGIHTQLHGPILGLFLLLNTKAALLGQDPPQHPSLLHVQQHPSFLQQPPHTLKIFTSLLMNTLFTPTRNTFTGFYITEKTF